MLDVSEENRSDLLCFLPGLFFLCCFIDGFQKLDVFVYDGFHQSDLCCFKVFFFFVVVTLHK